MDFFGYKKGRILLIIAAIGLFAFVVWPFLRGGRTAIQTEFMPMNTQMQAMISPTMEEIIPEEKQPAKKSDAKSGPVTDSKPTPTSVNSSADSSETLKATSSETLNAKPEEGFSSAQPKGQLDLNAATLEQLDELPGIGESKARAILEYRMKKGRFSRIDELTEVKGIGEKMLEKLRVLLYITPS